MKWFSAPKEKNHLKEPDSDGVSDEKIQEQLKRLEELRQEIIYPYAEIMGNCDVVPLGGDHMIYEQKPEECGEVIKLFIDGLDG